jgi:hypothetical protein
MIGMAVWIWCEWRIYVCYFIYVKLNIKNNQRFFPREMW